jgi:ABC-type cobalamin/Fe3+-siderophores transport system ATPase subunit
MFNVCEGCGLWMPEPEVDRHGPDVVCGHCGFRRRFGMLPLHIITGPSGAGKTTLCGILAPTMEDVVCLESDLLWGALPASADDDYRGYWDHWLHLAAAIGQAGRPVVLFGTTIPERIESVPNRRFFSTVRYLALVCDDDELARRLRARPAWRGCDEPFIAGMLAYNRRLREQAAAGTLREDLMETTGLDTAEAARRVAAWIRAA